MGVPFDPNEVANNCDNDTNSTSHNFVVEPLGRHGNYQGIIIIKEGKKERKTKHNKKHNKLKISVSTTQKKDCIKLTIVTRFQTVKIHENIRLTSELLVLQVSS